ncbi:MAG: ABC transporter ATP-binding protein, partial [Dehalococcoidia bacterium]
YGQRLALDDFDLDVPAGSVFGLLGPNGSGKSTFITLVAAMEPVAEGQLSVFGLAPAAKLRGRLGVVFQENTLDPLMRVDEALRLCGSLFGLRDATARAGLLLEQFGLGGRSRDPISALSGGMRRRLEVVRALLHNPELLLLDEPTTGVDPDERRALWDSLLADPGQRTVLLATNDLPEADRACDRVAFIRDGQVVAAGTPAELKQGLRRDSVRLDWPAASDADLATIGAWPECGSVNREGTEVLVSVDDAAAFVPRLFALAGGSIRGVRIDAASLEDAYFVHAGARERPRQASGL